MSQTPEKKFEFPVYESLSRDASRIQENLLSSNDLVEEMVLFMQDIRTKSEQGLAPNTAFFLDKGARPIGYMFRRLFPFFCPTTPTPRILYTNIGRWHDNEKPYRGTSQSFADFYGRQVKSDGRILIVDDFSVTQNTLTQAANIIGSAFPEATVESVSVFSKVPRWHGDESGFVGVVEPTTLDYYSAALTKLNNELGTSYQKKEDVTGETNTRFWQIYHEVTNTIPITKRVLTPTARAARPELDAICAAIENSGNNPINRTAHIKQSTGVPFLLNQDAYFGF